MLRLEVSRVLPYQRELLFDLAADVERYPEFLPWWLSASILRHEGEVYYTDQVVGFGPVQQRFSSKTALRQPEEIEVTSIDGPFEYLRLVWRFAPLQGERCAVKLSGEIELRGALLSGLFGRAAAGTFGSILSAFENRARRHYGAASGP
ncbi:MAG: type II toxin-antitoxin system RatA family toxin [Propylenella sp.]